MGIAQADRLLKHLRRKGAESANVDAKEYLPLELVGDRATFVRHVAALANTGRKAYLIIGVEDKTWIATGLPEDSSLRDVDQSQQQMNQILAKRLDPPLDVDYYTSRADGVVVGVVEVNGTRPPYVIAIEDREYGGESTKRAASSIYRGAIYVRRSANSVIANRQGEILRVLEGRRDLLGAMSELVLVAVIVGAGVGIGGSRLPFATPGVAGVVGSAWGLIVGLILRRRVAETIRGFFGAPWIRNAAGVVVAPLWGATLGWAMAYSLIDSALKGDLIMADPIMMGTIYGPVTAIALVFLSALAIAVAGYLVTSVFRAVDSWIRRRS
jgi:hypothetical protein